MSADSQHRSKSQGRTNGDPVTVSPQQVTDPTILDSVAGFISDVVPNAYNTPGESKDQIQWAHFEHLHIDDCAPHGDPENPISAPLILVLGYTNGVQVWSIPANGEAVELFSWKHGSVRVLKILPKPFRVGRLSTDTYIAKRPLIALCDNNSPSPHFCSLSFLSLKTSEQVKVIKFKNPILAVHANSNAVVVTFSERIAVFDAFTLEDRLTVTTCYISPGLYPNPIALGTRWMAYAENKILTQKRSSGGNEGEGVQSYTATMIHAAKSLGRGLRELSETVASSLTGNVPYKPGMNTCNQTGTEVSQKGIVTVLDIESQNTIPAGKSLEADPIICHFAAHKEAIVCLSFDPSGLLLLTADKGGHDFHLFRIHSHPGGPSLAAIHHLYVLHRGDTTARVQDMCFSPDSRWVTVSTLRGTTHVFPITPYGGPVGVRTHATPHVVNKMSRFHRSAGLTVEGRSNSPVSLFEAPVNSNLPYNNPRLPPYPHPTFVSPLAQIRQPVYTQTSTNAPQRSHSGRQRLGSSSEDNIQVVLRVCATFAPPRAWINNVLPPREVVHKPPSKPVEALFVMSCHGSLIQYDLDPHSVSNIPKEKVCDDTPIELTVHANAQWVLQRQPNGKDVLLPLSIESLKQIHRDTTTVKNSKSEHNDDRWLSQVEIVTHAGPHRRLWMGPQFTFKTYHTNSGTSINILDSKPLDLGRSKPVNMPVTSTYPVLIEAGSVSSCEPSPKLLDICQKNFNETSGAGELQLKEDLADAMLESPGVREADTLADMQFVPLSQSKKQPFDIITPPPLEKLEFPRRAQSPEDHLISLKTPAEEPPNQFEDEQLPEHIKKEKQLKNDRYQGLEQKDIISSSEENTIEEKTIAKKPRKPKTKLGVRIINIPKENDNEKDDISVDFHISLPKRSWSNVAASKSSLIEASDEVAQTSDTKRFSNTTTVSYSNIVKRDTIELENTHEKNLMSLDVLEPEKIQYECKVPEIDLLKLDKSSDEDKIEGSQTETTESDDSGKIPVETVAMDIEEDGHLETVKSTTGKIIKKKSKKKRR